MNLPSWPVVTAISQVICSSQHRTGKCLIGHVQSFLADTYSHLRKLPC